MIVIRTFTRVRVLFKTLTSATSEMEFAGTASARIWTEVSNASATTDTLSQRPATLAWTSTNAAVTRTCATTELV